MLFLIELIADMDSMVLDFYSHPTIVERDDFETDKRIHDLYPHKKKRREERIDKIKIRQRS